MQNRFTTDDRVGFFVGEYGGHYLIVIFTHETAGHVAKTVSGMVRQIAGEKACREAK